LSSKQLLNTGVNHLLEFTGLQLSAISHKLLSKPISSFRKNGEYRKYKKSYHWRYHHWGSNCIPAVPGNRDFVGILLLGG